jgi:hypothetical protein
MVGRCNAPWIRGANGNIFYVPLIQWLVYQWLVYAAVIYAVLWYRKHRLRISNGTTTPNLLVSQFETAAGEDVDNFALAEALFSCFVGRIGAD